MSDTTTPPADATPAYVPPGYHTLIPYICVHDGRAAHRLVHRGARCHAARRGDRRWTTAGSATPSCASARPC